ncbi:MAG TPA: nucleotidyl transferase AbiEii/AbiGii toxin family protein [Polyangiaceae bacterium]
MSLSAAQVAALRELDEQWPEAKNVIIGATALGFYYEMRWRQTADVDLALAIELRDFPGALPERPGWKRHPKKQHEFRSPQGVKIDILPAGPGLLDAGQIAWSGEQVMSLAGMDLAFRYAEQRKVVHGYTASVAPPRVIAVLKMTAYCDRPAERERDLEDIAHLLATYVDDDSDRRWDEAVDQEFDLAPAYLMGLDVGRTLETESHRAIVERFMSRVEDSESPIHAQMLRRGPATWRREENALARRLAVFKLGLEGG